MSESFLHVANFLRVLVAELNNRGLQLTYRNREPWHRAAYEFWRRATEKGLRPPEVKALTFEWDGPYPTSPELDEVLDTFHECGVFTLRNPQFQQVQLDTETVARWSKLNVSSELRTLLGEKGVADEISRYFEQYAPAPE